MNILFSCSRLYFFEAQNSGFVKTGREQRYLLRHVNRLLEVRSEFPLFFKKAETKQNEKKADWVEYLALHPELVYRVHRQPLVVRELMINDMRHRKTICKVNRKFGRLLKNPKQGENAPAE